MAKALTTAIVTFALILLFVPSLLADVIIEPPSDLTLEILQTKTTSLIQQAGRATIDLSNHTIDLSAAESEFNQQFYQEINNVISHANNAININFDNSTIKGYFQLSQLGITSSLGEGILPSLFTDAEKTQINQYYPVTNANNRLRPKINIFRGSLFLNNTIFTGKVDAENSMFLQSISAVDAKFQGDTNFKQVFFGRNIDFSNVTFEQNANFSESHFFAQVSLKQAQFKGIADFSHSQFEALTVFNEALFAQIADFTRCVFLQLVDFSQARFSDRLIFAKCKFLDSISLINSSLEKTVTFRDIYLNSRLNLEDAHILNRLDFSNAFFTANADLNVSKLAFEGTEANIIGQPGVIGKLLHVNRLTGNETILRNLIRNFRSLEQIVDANSLEYQQQQLRVTQISDRLSKTSWRKIFTWSWISLIPQWICLNLLLLLGDYGTNINLLFSIGLINTAWFSILFWLIDRYRPHISQPIIPNQLEIIWMLSSYISLTLISIFNIFIATNRPWQTLVTIAIFIIPVPILIAFRIYQRGRYHQLLNQSYFVENGALREFRLLLGRLPIMPRFDFFRDRYLPILWTKRWNWLNYYNLSLNNTFKIGFIDIRIRDRHLPGLIATLVWYQWSLGVLYVILLLWTLSRTIPGLNLLIYF
ncbi:MAG: pentapeptide repeat-containing protein [Cyanobacteria bacterium P01_G01_bin.67]